MNSIRNSFGVTIFLITHLVIAVYNHLFTVNYNLYKNVTVLKIFIYFSLKKYNKGGLLQTTGYAKYCINTG